jgi:hypothetical protein
LKIVIITKIKHITILSGASRKSFIRVGNIYSTSLIMKLSKICFALVIFAIAFSMNNLTAQNRYKPADAPYVGGFLEGYNLQGQQQNQWCWAASGAMVMTYVSADNAPSQCTEATDRNGGNCCSNGSSSTCNQPGWPEFSRYGYNSTTTNGVPLTFEQIKDALKANSPVCFTWYWTSGGGHMMTVSGWHIINGKEYVYVRDPWPVNKGTTKWMTYEAYVKGSNYRHGSDIYNFSR